MKINWFSATSLCLAVLMFMLAFANVGSAGASQTWVMWHHVDQGARHDETWTKCMPNDSINGHNGHTGDYLVSGPYSDDDCEHLIVSPTPTNTNTPTPVPPTATNTLAPTATPVPPTPTSPATYVVCRFKGGEWSTDNIGAPDLANFYAQFPSGFIVDDEHPCPPEDTSTPTPVVTEVTPTDPACGDGENQQPCVTETVVPTVTPVVIDTPVGIWVPTCEEMSKMSPNEFVRWTNRWVNLKDANGLSCDERGFHTGDGNGFATILFGVGALLALLGVGSFVFGKKV